MRRSLVPGLRRLLFGDPNWHLRSEEPPRRWVLSPFSWRTRLTGWTYFRGTSDPKDVGLEMFRTGIAPDRDHEIRLARTRWLETNRVQGSFGCGVAIEETAGAPAVPDPWGEARKDAAPVTIAVTADEFVFLQEGSAEPGTEPLVEAGRFPRRAFASVHLEDARGQRVIGPAGEVFEPATPCRLVVSWRGPDGTEQQHAFGFMSLSVAEDAAGRFRRFAGPA